MPSKRLDSKYKKTNGVVYTPKWIVETILNHIGYYSNNQIYSKKIIDPACGDGAFLTIVVDRFIKCAINEGIPKKKIKELIENNIWGIDIDNNAILQCERNLNNIAKKYGLENIKWKLINKDTTESWIYGLFGKFDYVVGNPPYIRIQNLSKNKRKTIQNLWKTCGKGSTDIYIAFFEIGYYLMNKNGILGYITPNTYTKTMAGKELRCFIKNKKILKELIDFKHHQIFKDATTYSIITILSKSHNSEIFKLYYGDSDGNISFVDYININDLNDNNWILCPKDILLKINEIEKRGLPLGKIADIHVGITTLADDYYIFENPKFDGNIAEIKLKDGRTFKIEKDILKPIVKVSTLKSPDDCQNRYIIFPYKLINGKYSIIPENELKNNYPLTYNYFTEIKDILLARDKGKKNPVAWYAFGRSQGLDTSFGKKILTAPMNKKPNFIVWEKEEYTFYSGYCIKFDGDLQELAKELNSSDMEFYINNVSRCYQNGYKSYSKTYIKNYGISNHNIIKSNISSKSKLNDDEGNTHKKHIYKNYKGTLLDYLNG